MGLFNLLTILIVLAALFSFLNHRLLKLPTTIGVMLIALVASLALIGAGHAGLDLVDDAERILLRIDFDEALLHGMLGFLLFAGALHVNFDELAAQGGVIFVLSTVGVVASTLIVGVLAWLVFGWLDIAVPLAYCLVLGALISPTDPIAVQGIIRSAGAPKTLETKITGESLFNDGMGVVTFLVLLSVATGKEALTAAYAARVFFIEAGGGILIGLGIGFLGYALIKQVDQYQVEVMLSLAVVMGTYAVAWELHTSAPLAAVVAGILLGNHGRAFAMSPKTQEHLDAFWELLDEILNAVLFLLVGLEILVLPLSRIHLLAGIILVPAVLLARLASVGATVASLSRWRPFSPGSVSIMTWAGLRGGISVAMALSLPEGPFRAPLLAATYTVVVFSIVVQGLTVGRLVRRFGPTEA